MSGISDVHPYKRCVTFLIVFKQYFFIHFPKSENMSATPRSNHFFGNHVLCNKKTFKKHPTFVAGPASPLPAKAARCNGLGGGAGSKQLGVMDF